jgi:hypothetical protein
LINDNDDSASGAFSIQNIVKMGFVNEKFPGEWYGPQALSTIIKVYPSIFTYKFRT